MDYACLYLSIPVLIVKESKGKKTKLTNQIDCSKYANICKGAKPISVKRKGTG